MPLWKEELKEFGIVIIKGIELEPEHLIALGKEMAEEIFAPMAFFTNKDERYPELVRIGNVLMDGTLKDSKLEFAVWH